VAAEPITMRNPASFDSPLLFRLYWCASLSVVAGLCGTSLLLRAQAPVAPLPHAAAHKPVRRQKHPVAAPAPTPLPIPVAVAPPLPEAPKWPATEKPDPASVTWDSHGLRIQARNSSLHQILDDVSMATGVEVEGMGSDQRIFGAYGPGQARDVLTQLLQGSGYNIVMVGDQGQGAPRQIVLSPRKTGDGTQSARSGQPNPAEEEQDVEDEPPPAPPLRPGGAPGAPFRSPQQLMQEMQRQQQQQQLQQIQPQPVPPPK